MFMQTELIIRERMIQQDVWNHIPQMLLHIHLQDHAIQKLVSNIMFVTTQMDQNFTDGPMLRLAMRTQNLLLAIVNYISFVMPITDRDVRMLDTLRLILLRFNILTIHIMHPELALHKPYVY